MASHDVIADTGAADRTRSGGGFGAAAQRLTTETKAFFKTSEWWTYLAIVIAILIAGNSIEGEEGGGDFFAADKVWLYVTLLTIGYMISRGIAKAGVRDPYFAERGEPQRRPLAPRLLFSSGSAGGPIRFVRPLGSVPQAARGAVACGGLRGGLSRQVTEPRAACRRALRGRAQPTASAVSRPLPRVAPPACARTRRFRR